MTRTLNSPAHRVHRPPGREPLRTAVRGLGEVLITLGLVLLLFVFYEVYVTGWLSEGKQRRAEAALHEQWRTGGRPVPVQGQAFAALHIPAITADYPVLEGTDQETLSIGPGHYIGTALPGQPGSFAVAGHRVGQGAPFNDLHLLASCDALVVETADAWSVYRVLPMPEEAADWASGKGRDPRCAGVTVLPAPYELAVGRRIVAPSAGEVIAPVPGRLGLQPPPEQLRPVITLTTCHPRFSARQRMVIHGVLVRSVPKGLGGTGAPPPELASG